MAFKKYFSRRFKNLLTTAIVSFIIVACGALLIQFLQPRTLVQSTTKNSSVLATPVAPTIDSMAVNVAPSIKKQTTVHSQITKHLPYQQAKPNRMMIVASYAMGKYQRFEFLDPEAGKALIQLIYAARDEGVWLIPVSGFRTIKQQQELFEDQIERLGSVKAALKVSAPSGYSEHHTGFAVDLADGRFPKQDVTYKFENTDAYRWLTVRAKEFGFEMSFPPNNTQGVSFEPWHWRYVGSPCAAAIFTTARSTS